MFNSHDLRRAAILVTFFFVIAGCTEDTPVNDKPTPHKPFEIGSTVTDQQISGWDIDIRPDGKGLPKGQGSVGQGEFLYDQKCASCHGTFGEGEGRWPALAGGAHTLTDDRPSKTVGSYWPYASTLWDYIRRAMPFTEPQSLEVDEVYALTAYVLNLNEIVDDDFVLTQFNLAEINMPNQDGFFIDTRPDSNNTRCMNDCLATSTLKVTHTINGITPEKGTSEAKDSIVKTPQKALQVNEIALPSPVGEQVYQQACVSCHKNGVAGAPITGNKTQWQPRIELGMELLYQHAIKGLNAMPPKGGQSHIKDENIREAVNYMVEQSQ
jgi:cytochrome c